MPTSTELIPLPSSSPDVTGLNKFSRYYTSKIYTVGSEKFFETWDILEVPQTIDDKFHQITAGEEGRWDLLSHRYYKTVLYWWIICLANGIKNPLQVLPAGNVVRIPSTNTIYHLIEGRRLSLSEYILS